MAPRFGPREDPPQPPRPARTRGPGRVGACYPDAAERPLGDPSSVGCSIMNKTDLVDLSYLRTDVPEFRPGDSVKVHVRAVRPGNSLRPPGRVGGAGRGLVVVFGGVVPRGGGGALQETFTVRKI